MFSDAPVHVPLTCSVKGWAGGLLIHMTAKASHTLFAVKPERLSNISQGILFQPSVLVPVYVSKFSVLVQQILTQSLLY